MERKPIIELHNIVKYYGDNCVVDNIDLDIYENEFITLLGPSGCGKTTLLRIIIGLIKPNEGTIIKDGVDITNYEPSNRHMGFVFQNYALFENMSVLKNIEYALKIKKETKYIARETALKLIDLMNLKDEVNKKPSELSGGQQQRVAIARSLALKPDIILFDEPMSALDVATRLTLRKELKNIKKKFNTTMIYITHDQEEAFSMSDRILIMKNGSAIQIDTPENIIKHPTNDYVQSFVIDNLKTKIDSLAKYIKLTK